MKKNKNKKDTKNIEKELEVKEEVSTDMPTEEKKVKKGIKYNKKLLYIIPSFVVSIIILLLVITRTNVVPNILGIDTNKTARITNITYQGKNKYQIESTSKFLVETKNIAKDDLNKYLALEPAYNYTIENVGKNKFKISR